LVTTSRLDGRTKVVSSTTAAEDADEVAAIEEEIVMDEEVTATPEEFELLLPPQPVNAMSIVIAKPYFTIE